MEIYETIKPKSTLLANRKTNKAQACPFCSAASHHCEKKDGTPLKAIPQGFHFGSKKNTKISIVSEDLSRNSVFFRTEMKPYMIDPPPHSPSSSNFLME